MLKGELKQIGTKGYIAFHKDGCYIPLDKYMEEYDHKFDTYEEALYFIDTTSFNNFKDSVIEVNFEQAELGYEPLSSFLYNNVVITDPGMDESMQEYVDPKVHYNAAYSSWLKELVVLQPKCVITKMPSGMLLVVVKDCDQYTIMYDDSSVCCNKSQIESELSKLEIPQNNLGGLYVK